MKNNIISKPMEIDTKNTPGLLLNSVIAFSSFSQPFWSPIPQLVNYIFYIFHINSTFQKCLLFFKLTLSMIKIFVFSIVLH